MGPEGLVQLYTANSMQVDRLRALRASGDTAALDPALERVSHALDAVGAQRDNWAQRLYWYTDLDKAEAAAKATGRPILSLRLLRRLDEELSCANSRFFRTALYANERVAYIMQNRFILHWQTVRPVPTVTIDFGDGRRIERTITGNSLH